MKLILLMALITSCAHKSRPEVDPLNVSTYNPESVLDLVKNSYIKGCIDGKNEIYSIKTKGRRLTKCRDLSTAHVKAIRELLTQEIKIQPQ